MRRRIVQVLSVLTLFAAAVGCGALFYVLREPASASVSSPGAGGPSQDGLMITSGWALTGAGGSALSDTITVKDVGPSTVQAKVEVPVPEAGAADLSTIRVSARQPDMVTAGQVEAAQHVVVWQVDLRSQRKVVVSYRVAIAADGVTKARLRQLTSGVGAPQVQVWLLTLRQGKALKVQVGSYVVLSGLQGQMSDGMKASSAILAGAAWKLGNAAAAELLTRPRADRVTGLRAGTASLIAVVSGVSCIVTVTVEPAPQQQTQPQPGPGPTSPAVSPHPKTSSSPTASPLPT